VFETLEAGPGADLAPNLRRLAESALAIGVTPPPADVLLAEIEAVRAAIGPRAVIRVNLGGDGARQVYGTAPDPARRFQPATAGRAPHRDDPLLSGEVKHRSRELRRRQVDELLFVDAAGRFTEGTSCAVLAAVGGTLFTAPWDGRILRSTTLERLLAHAERAGIPVVREGPAAAGPWDALYIASTTRSIAPVSALDGVPLGGWDEVGRTLQRAEG
jgi:branched-subunit amino acid aminotransferase/4-amino-4-deoxychorismate lyase